MRESSHFERPVLTVVSNADARFFPGLAVALASAVAAASSSYDYQFLILDGGLSTSSLAELRSVITHIAARKNIHASVDLLEVDLARLKALPSHRGSYMTYAKLILPDAIPHLDSIVYLDADVLCFAGLEAVHPPAEEQGNWILAGARDHINVIENDCPWSHQLTIVERKLPYINAGIMWMNLKGIREMDFTELNRIPCPSILDAGSSLLVERATSDSFRHDQTIFNYLCRGRSFILPASLNHRTSIGSSLPLCNGDLNLNLHYIGSPKPWIGPPKTSNWLAHRLWHQARSMLFPSVGVHEKIAPADLQSIRRKAILYTLVNPVRSRHYRNDLRSLSDPGNILERAKIYWEALAIQ